MMMMMMSVEEEFILSFLIVCSVLSLFLSLLFWDFDADDELPECGN